MADDEGSLRMLSAGTKIGVYEVTALIGAGGMGEVYRARDTRLNRDVALKVLPEAFSRDPERMARFEREAKTAGVAQSSEHRRDLRPGRIRRDPRVGDGIGRRANAGRPRRRRAHSAGRGSADRQASRRRRRSTRTSRT